VPGFEEDVIVYEAANGPAELRVFRAVAAGVLHLGWNRPLAGALSADGRRWLSDWLAEALREHRPDGKPVEAETRVREDRLVAPAFELVDGFVPHGTAVTGVLELQRVLAHWIEASDQPTVGDVGTFGGSPVITVRMGADEFVLNRDTKRAAVRAFLGAAGRAGGADRLRWHVATNARGGVNRVTYRSDDAPTPGWYAYIRGVSEPRDLE
jgi:hypothetical protein